MDRIEIEHRRRIDSTILESDLPCPRLELRWEVNGREKRCDYNFVLPITSGDVRIGCAAQFGSELRFCMGWTTCSSIRENHPVFPNGLIDMPYRDESHIAWDSHSTGLPAFVVWDGKAQSILSIKPTGEPVVDQPDEHPMGDKDWGHRAATNVLEEAQKLIRRTAFMVRDLRDQHRKKSWPWLYYHSMWDKLRMEADGIRDHSFEDFGNWMRFTADGIKIDNVKRVCAECGADIPRDLTKACEHIFGEDSRKFLGEGEDDA